MTSHHPTSLRSGFVATLRDVLRDKGALMIFVAAPLFYAFFYPWFFGPEVVTRIPVAVVDQDHSALSRSIHRLALANPRIEVKAVGADERAAQAAMSRGEIDGYLVLPDDLKAHVARGMPAMVTVVSNGAYPLISKAVQYGFSEAVGAASAGVEIRQREAKGQSPRQAGESRTPVDFRAMALFNPTEGYSSFIVPAVALFIMHQTLLMGVGMLVATWVERGAAYASPMAWIGRWLAFLLPGLVSGLFYFGWVFWLYGYPRANNVAGSLVFLVLYVSAIVTLGSLVGLWCRDRERVLQVLLFSTLPMVFLAGFSWPPEALPLPLQYLRWLIPTTSGVQAALRLNQMGAPLQSVMPYLGCLLALTVVAGSFVLKFGGKPQGD
ncbi:MAG: ABC transporter permease [Burkholderiales bacterium]|jgi:ABC-2 type transport system permease protein|nr:ABC transporter permease [Burkholderiales bacterium]OXE35106.1 MAG: ABC transporter [Phenylobacterium zucineum]